MNGRDVARDEIDALLKDVVLEAVSISFRNEGNALRFQSDYYQRLSKRGLANDVVRGGLWFRELNADLALALLTDETHRGFGSLGLDGVQFYDEGANIPQQLAATLAWANDVLNGLRASGVSFEKISDNLGFALAIGPSFLPEVAKFRLIRFLWARILQQHGASAKRWRTWVHAETGKRHLSHLDTPVNLLRENAQAMSAVIGGVDSLIVHPFRRNEEELAERLAINTQHLMKEEARLARVIDPAAGSYYVEHLTDIIGRHAWDLFKQIEVMGGYSAAVANGFLAETFEKTDAAYTAEVDKLERVVVGVNKYPTPFEGSNDL
jgi:methylmalonyl-CoA mutase